MVSGVEGIAGRANIVGNAGVESVTEADAPTHATNSAVIPLSGFKRLGHAATCRG